MIKSDAPLGDLTIHWPYKSKRIATIRRTGRCPLHCQPRKLREHAIIVLVDDQGVGMLQFTLSRIESASIRAADGKRIENGYELIAKSGSVRTPPNKYLYPVNNHHIGALRYFNERTGRGILHSDPAQAASKGAGAPPPRERSPHVYPFFARSLGLSLSQPERKLVRDYVAWIGNEDSFGHTYLSGPKLYSDLFVRSCWALVEAKASVDRTVLRTALGQLQDYQRYYRRRPQLAVLLPCRPSKAMEELFGQRSVTVIWQNKNGSFGDSADGKLTSVLRAKQKQA